MSISESTRQEQQESENMPLMPTQYHECLENLDDEVESNRSTKDSSGGNYRPFLDNAPSLTSSEAQEVRLQEVRLQEIVNAQSLATIRPSVSRHAPDRLTCHTAPHNYSAVIPGAVYRSGFPEPKNFTFLKSLRLKTILTLVPEPFGNEYVDFMRTNGIRQIVVPVPANKEVVCIEDATIIQALGAVLDRSNYPLLIHCNKGKHRTGCTVACFRRLLGATIQEALDEYQTHAGLKARSLDETFIRNFNTQRLLRLVRKNGAKRVDELAIDSPRPTPVKFARLRG